MKFYVKMEVEAIDKGLLINKTTHAFTIHDDDRDYVVKQVMMAIDNAKKRSKFVGTDSEAGTIPVITT